MAVIDIANCTVTLITPMAGMNFWSIVTPSEADDADTVDVSSVAGKVYSANCLGASDGLLTAAVSAAGVVTLPGATDNEARTIYIFGEAA